MDWGAKFYFSPFSGLVWLSAVGAFMNQITINGLKYDQWLSVIVNLTSKVYGPSIKNYYEPDADLGLMNLVLLGFQDFLGERRRLWWI
jgi:hypothetical protein